MDSRLQVAGQQTVLVNKEGITITDDDTPSDKIRMVGGAILLSKQDKNGQTKWVTGITSDGISANLITAGTINAGEISIMNNGDPLFRWDSYGLSAFDAKHTTVGDITTTSGIDTSKFVRFDKHGLYGVDGKDGTNYIPEDQAQIDRDATFALTWEGLKVTGKDAVARIGKQGDNIMTVTKGRDTTFSITGEGEVTSSKIRLTGGVIESGNFVDPLQKGKLLSDDFIWPNRVAFEDYAESMGNIIISVCVTDTNYAPFYYEEVKGPKDFIIDGEFEGFELLNYPTTSYGAPFGGIYEIAPSSGMRINLNNGTITSPNFSIDEAGNATMSGTVYATDGEFTGTISAKNGGNIGGFTIGKSPYSDNSCLKGEGVIGFILDPRAPDSATALSIGNNFKVSGRGIVEIHSINTTKRNSEYASDSQIVGNGYSIDKDGNLSAKIISATSVSVTSLSATSTFNVSKNFEMLMPEEHKTVILIDKGSTTFFGEVESGTSSRTISDRTKKHSIQPLPSVYSDIFDKLQPVSYKYNDGRSDRTHTGFIAQDVEQAVIDCGLTTQDFAAVCYEINPETGEKEDYTIRYEELIALCVQQIQTQSKQIATLEERLARLEQKLNQ